MKGVELPLQTADQLLQHPDFTFLPSGKTFSCGLKSEKAWFRQQRNRDCLVAMGRMLQTQGVERIFRSADN